jgi:transcriptional regulator with XRE-family HTH domain
MKNTFMKKQMKKLTPARRAEVKNRSLQLQLCSKLVSLREGMGITQKQVAKKMYVTQPVISQIEQGQNITVLTLIKYLKAINCGLSIKIITDKPFKIIDNGKVIFEMNLLNQSYITV